uniref:UPAR/Ly6 domain-containing protein n=1 Tax=Moschus moschiferus TaxID=68415 RepID=A0A8C6MHP3_MOSMO
MPFTRDVFSGASGIGVTISWQVDTAGPWEDGGALCAQGQVLCPGARMPPPRWKPRREKPPASRTFVRRRETVSVQEPRVTGALPPELPGGWPGRTLRCWFDFPALECFQCHKVNASGVCESRGSTCQTQDSQECFLRRIYEDGTLSYGHQGCSQLCIPMKLFNVNVTVEYKCCHDSPLCNKF